jgi:hypothetical protein
VLRGGLADAASHQRTAVVVGCADRLGHVLADRCRDADADADTGAPSDERHVDRAAARG